MMGAGRELSDWSTPPLSMRIELRCVQILVCGEQHVVWTTSEMLLSSVEPRDLVEVCKNQ